MKRKFAAALAIMLVILMILALIAPYIVRAEVPEAGQRAEITADPALIAGDTVNIAGQDRDFLAEISALEAQLKVLQEERAALYNQYAKAVSKSQSKQAEINGLLAEMNGIADQIEEYQDSIAIQEGLIAGLNMEIQIKVREITDQEEKLAKAEANAQEYTDYLSFRLKQMYEQREQSTLELLLSSKDLGDFFCRVEYMRQVYEYDKHCVEELRKIRDEIAEILAAIEKAKAELETERKECEELCIQLEENKRTLTDLLEQKSIREAALEAELADLVSASNSQAAVVDRKDAEIRQLETKLANVRAEYSEFRRKQEELMKSQQAVSSHPMLSGMLFFWPLWNRSNTYISEGWGYHYHPITGKYTKHYGIDIPADRGTPIHACESGVVVAAYTSGWNSGYGNLIIIQHSNGVQTWYGHCNTVKVRVGQNVNRGDIIGTVGTTGNSTGYHLHLELIISGSDVDPEKYVGKVWPAQ